MKRLTIQLLFIVVAVTGGAQNNESNIIAIKAPVVVPPSLSVVPNSVRFIETNENGIIDADETCFIKFQIQNKGTGDAEGCTAKIQAKGTINGLSYENQKLPIIKSGEAKEITIPVRATKNTRKGEVDFSIQIDEPNGFGTDPIALTIQTRAFDNPFIRIVDYGVSGKDSEGKLKKNEPFNLQIVLQNTEHGRAEDIEVDITLPENVCIASKIDNRHISISNLNGGDSELLEYELIVSRTYPSDIIPIHIKLKEKYGRYSEDKTINLELDQTLMSPIQVNVRAAEMPKQGDIQLATVVSGVDKNIPVCKQKNDKTFVVIIANEKYQEVSPVEYARNDGSVFKKYCEETLGIPQEHIHYKPDATLLVMQKEVKWLKDLMQLYSGEAKIIFYYAGHGIPDASGKEAFLLPVDGIDTGFKLNELYSSLGEWSAQSVVIFLDACFSGSKRGEGMLASTRGVALKVKQGVPQGNMVVFSAAQGDETAYPYNKERHGMFTYYLLKMLQETQGDVTLGSLQKYICDKVPKESTINCKPQHPCVTPSASLGEEWQSWTLK